MIKLYKIDGRHLFLTSSDGLSLRIISVPTWRVCTPGRCLWIPSPPVCSVCTARSGECVSAPSGPPCWHRSAFPSASQSRSGSRSPLTSVTDYVRPTSIRRNRTDRHLLSSVNIIVTPLTLYNTPGILTRLHHLIAHTHFLCATNNSKRQVPLINKTQHEICIY